MIGRVPASKVCLQSHSSPDTRRSPHSTVSMLCIGALDRFGASVLPKQSLRCSGSTLRQAVAGSGLALGPRFAKCTCFVCLSDRGNYLVSPPDHFWSITIGGSSTHRFVCSARPPSRFMAVCCSSSTPCAPKIRAGLGRQYRRYLFFFSFRRCDKRCFDELCLPSGARLSGGLDQAAP